MKNLVFKIHTNKRSKKSALIFSFFSSFGLRWELKWKQIQNGSGLAKIMKKGLPTTMLMYDFSSSSFVAKTSWIFSSKKIVEVSADYFISLIECNRYVNYDKRLNEFKNIVKKNEAWERISKLCHTTGKTIKSNNIFFSLFH